MFRCWVAYCKITCACDADLNDLRQKVPLYKLEYSARLFVCFHILPGGGAEVVVVTGVVVVMVVSIVTG